MEPESLTHPTQVWPERTNFIIGARVPSDDDSDVQRWEQLWARQISDNRFEICCIPFFVYNIALGDEVETGPELGKQYMIQRVTKPSGHYTYRVWFGDTAHPPARQELVDAVTRLGCLCEWSSEDLLAIDAASDNEANILAQVLIERQQLGHLLFESGWT